MRLLLTALILLLPAAAVAQPHFLSPMGEPFRGDGPAADNAGAWFATADTDRDGGLARSEMRLDADRFFASLDGDGNGEIGPATARYENEIAPEVQVGLQMRGAGVGDWRGAGSRRRRVAVYDKGIEGAGRYAFLNIPQPVIAADMDMNRGVSREEFASAAAERFALLDANRDGRLARAELPPLPQPRLRKKRNDEDDAAPFRQRRPGY